MNNKLLTKIKEDPAFLSGEKPVESILSDSSIHSQLDQEDIDHLYEYEDGLKNVNLMHHEIEEIGVNIKNVSSFSELNIHDYHKIVPILISWIPKQKSYMFKEALIRELSVPAAKEEALPVFINEFISAHNDDTASLYKWAIGSGLDVFASDDIVDKLISLALDKKHGAARQMIVLGLGKIKDPVNKEKVTDVLISLLKDDDVAGHAIEALGKLEAKRARPYVEIFLTHKKVWWRNAAKSAIKKFTKHSN